MGDQQCHFENRTHLLWAGQPVNGGQQCAARLGRGQYAGLFGARCQPDPHQELALWNGRDQACPGRGCGSCKGGKIHPVGEVRLSRRVKDINWLVVCHRLQAVTGIAGASIIVIQHRTATSRHLPFQRGYHEIGLWALFQHRTVHRWTTSVFHDIHGNIFWYRRADDKTQPSVNDADLAVVPMAGMTHKLCHERLSDVPALTPLREFMITKLETQNARL